MTETASAYRTAAAKIGIAAAIGVVVGVIVLALEHAVDDIVKELFEAPVWVPAVVVAIGAVVTAIVTHYLSDGRTATTEVYVREFHRDEPALQPKRAPGRLLGAFTTLASGAPLGMEGPAVYSGSVAAAIVQRRSRALGADLYHAFLVAGAAAGIAAVFKAPAAGAIFAMEVPFRGRLAGERVLPAIFGSAAGYLTMATIDGVEPELTVPLIELSYGRVALCLVLGIVVGVAAIGVIKLVEQAEHSHARFPAWARALVAGAGLAGIYAIGRGLTGEPVALSSGNKVIEWAIQPDHAVLVLLGVFALRAVGPGISIMGGGVGGLFIPLMAMGAVIGRLFADAVSAEELALFVVVGAACMLGAGYAVPLTAVVFAAEYTGQASVVVPALVAVATMRLITGSRSVSPNQLE